MAGVAKPRSQMGRGKTQLIDQIDMYLPPEMKAGKITTYVEPMVGGGAVFFHMKQHYGDSLKNYYISDYNWDLFVLYRIIQSRCLGS